MLIIMKFGGTSVGAADRVAQMVNIVREQVALGERVVVVVSAMSGVTNSLLTSANLAANGSVEWLKGTRDQLEERHVQVIRALIKSEEARRRLLKSTADSLDGFENLCRSIHLLGELTARAADAVAALGERLMAPIAAQALSEAGVPSEPVDATSLIVTDDCYGAADPIMEGTREKTRAALIPLLEAGKTPVTTGFIAATRDGVLTTLGRGGSDYTATLIGSALQADQVWIWTDVDGVMTTDPRIVAEAQTLPEISYGEAAELAYFGAKVIHPKTILPAAASGIPIRILNSFHPEHPGTWIVREPRRNGSPVQAITAIRNLSLVTVEGRGMIGVPGMAARVFATVARERTNVLMISQSSSEQNICFMVESRGASRVIEALQKEFELERTRQNVENIWAQDGTVIIAIVGAGLQKVPGIAARVFVALASEGINIMAIAQGSSKYNLSLVVEESAADNAVRAIHSVFDM